jgi:Trk K+ transport system NAD-binding subunit
LLSSPHDAPKIKRIDPPKGRWLLCGYGRFGKAVYKKLLEHGLPVTVIEFDLDTTGAPEGSISGRGTEAETLLAAQVNKAVGIIAGTDNDVNNLSILITARDLNPEIFTIARQQLSSNSGMFSAASLDLVTSSSSLVASQLLARITTPMTTDFLSMASSQDEVWTRDLLKRIEHCTDSAIPEKWVVAPGYENAPAFLERWNKGETVYLHHLLREPTDRKQKLRCIALLLQRDGKDILLPGDKTVVELHDRILLAGSADAASKIYHILTSREILHYTMTGQHLPASLFLGWLMRKKTPTASSR